MMKSGNLSNSSITSLEEVLKEYNMKTKTAQRCLYGAIHIGQWEKMNSEALRVSSDEITSVLIGGELMAYVPELNNNCASWMTSAPNSDTLIDLGSHLNSCCLPSSPTASNHQFKYEKKHTTNVTQLQSSEASNMLTTILIYSDSEHFLEDQI